MPRHISSRSSQTVTALCAASTATGSSCSSAGASPPSRWLPAALSCNGTVDSLTARLRGIEALADAALSRLDEQALLETLVERVKNVLQADTAAILLLDQSASQLIATAASGIEDEVRQGVRIPLGPGFAGRVAASRKPVTLTEVNHATVRNPLL